MSVFKDKVLLITGGTGMSIPNFCANARFFGVSISIVLTFSTTGTMKL